MSVNVINSVGLLLSLNLMVGSSFAALVSPEANQTARFRVTNQCEETIWVQQDFKNHTQDPVVVQIPSHQAYDYTIPDAGLASTRFWPKMGCNTHGYDCHLGESTGVPDALNANIQHGPFAPDVNSKFEASFGCAPSIFEHQPDLCALNPSAAGQHLGNETWWNASAVDGYTLPYAIHVKNHNQTCFDLNSGKVLSDPNVDCGGLSVEQCPTSENLSTEGRFNVIHGVDVTHVNLQWKDASQKPIGCFSPCSKLTTAQGSDNGQTGGGWSQILGGVVPESPEAQMYCCPTPPISSEACSAGPAGRMAYGQSVQGVQKCDAYTYAYDDAKGLAKCGAQTQFEVIFCPKATIGGTTEDPNTPPVNPPAAETSFPLQFNYNPAFNIHTYVNPNNEFCLKNKYIILK